MRRQAARRLLKSKSTGKQDILKAALASAAFFIFAACAVTPEKTVTGSVGSAQGQWLGEAYVKDLKHDRSGTIDLDVVAQEPAHLRLEANGSFGVHLASIAMNDNQVHISLTREKKFIVAPATNEALARLVAVEVSPLDLMNLLFDRELDPRQWNCQRTDGLVSDCRKAEGSVLIHWDRSDQAQRRWEISSPAAKVQLHLTEAKSKVGFSKDVFTLNPPVDFKQEVLNR
jgi:hypothetical protein